MAQEILFNTINVGPIGASGQPTQIVAPSKTVDRRVTLNAAAAGVYLSHAPLRETTAGFPLPTGIVTFDIPAGTALWAISAMGTIQVGRALTPVLPTLGSVGTALLDVLQRLLLRLR